MSKQGLVWYAVVFSVFALCVSLLACMTQPAIVNTPRTVVGEYNTAVVFDVMCSDPSLPGVQRWFGSGVIVSADQVLTAFHVVDCPAPAITVTTIDGQSYQAFFEVGNKDIDVARVRLIGAHFDYPPPVVGVVPELGEHICIATGFPTRGHRCGEVELTHPLPGDLVHNAVVEPGNSGSGVYDVNGNLVAIVTHLILCNNGQICGGRATTLWDRRWLLP